MQSLSFSSPKRSFIIVAVAALGVACAQTPAQAAACGNGPAGFGAWLEAFKDRAVAKGIPQGVVNSALSGVSYDPKVIYRDRNQHSFKLSFAQFYARRVGPQLIARGRQRMATHAGTLKAIQKRYGVPPGVVVAIWGLETNYGADRGQGFSIVRSLATLAYDCRRSAFFEKELVASLQIIARGDMPASALRGGWAGEIGQTQFLPDAYVKYAVDFDGNGRRDLINSAADVLASTANYLKGHGWAAGQPWGPGTKNHEVIREWNRADVYVRTIAKLADIFEGN